MKNLWFPTLDSEKCDSCKGVYKCVGFCPYKVFELKNGMPIVANPLNCIYGCSSCGNLCRNGAIIFPGKQATCKSVKKDSSLNRVVCANCGKAFLTNRQTRYCFDCEGMKKHRTNFADNSRQTGWRKE